MPSVATIFGICQQAFVGPPDGSYSLPQASQHFMLTSFDRRLECDTALPAFALQSQAGRGLSQSDQAQSTPTTVERPGNFIAAAHKHAPSEAYELEDLDEEWVAMLNVLDSRLLEVTGPINAAACLLGSHTSCISFAFQAASGGLRLLLFNSPHGFHAPHAWGCLVGLASCLGSPRMTLCVSATLQRPLLLWPLN